MGEPTVDILMATCNGERFVAEQIESILWQDFADWRLLVSDDCSSDATLDIVRSYVSRDPRVVLASEGVRFGSAKSNFMHLLSLTDAPYAMFCDQDDVWLPEKVGSTLAKMREVEAAGETDRSMPILVFTDMCVVDEKLRIIAPSFEQYSNFDTSRTDFRQLVAHNIAAGCTMMLNKHLVILSTRAIRYREIVMHDWWVMLVAAAFGRIAYFEDVTSLYRQHDSNVVGSSGYSPLQRARDISFMQSQLVNSMRQSAYFEQVYKDNLNTMYRDSINEFSRIATSHSPIEAIIHLTRSGCWKRGTRKLGQMVVSARIGLRR